MTSQSADPTAQAIQRYRDLMGDNQMLVVKISELEMDRNEHVLVEETLKPLDPSRKAFRLIGECLVERTVGEVLPSVAANRQNVSACRFSLKRNIFCSFYLSWK